MKKMFCDVQIQSHDEANKSLHGLSISGIYQPVVDALKPTVSNHIGRKIQNTLCPKWNWYFRYKSQDNEGFSTLYLDAGLMYGHEEENFNVLYGTEMEGWVNVFTYLLPSPKRPFLLLHPDTMRVQNISNPYLLPERDGKNWKLFSMVTSARPGDFIIFNSTKVAHQKPPKGGVGFAWKNSSVPPPPVATLTSKCHNFFSIGSLSSLEMYVRQKFSFCLFF